VNKVNTASVIRRPLLRKAAMQRVPGKRERLSAVVDGPSGLLGVPRGGGDSSIFFRAEEFNVLRPISICRIVLIGISQIPDN